MSLQPLSDATVARMMSTRRHGEMVRIVRLIGGPRDGELKRFQELPNETTFLGDKTEDGDVPKYTYIRGEEHGLAYTDYHYLTEEAREIRDFENGLRAVGNLIEGRRHGIWSYRVSGKGAFQNKEGLKAAGFHWNGADMCWKFVGEETTALKWLLEVVIRSAGDTQVFRSPA